MAGRHEKVERCLISTMRKPQRRAKEEPNDTERRQNRARPARRRAPPWIATCRRRPPNARRFARPAAAAASPMQIPISGPARTRPSRATHAVPDGQSVVEAPHGVEGQTLTVLAPSTQVPPSSRHQSAVHVESTKMLLSDPLWMLATNIMLAVPDMVSCHEANRTTSVGGDTELASPTPVSALVGFPAPTLSPRSRWAMQESARQESTWERGQEINPGASETQPVHETRPGSGPSNLGTGLVRAPETSETSLCRR
jgi:hypothetical protein